MADTLTPRKERLANQTDKIPHCTRATGLSSRKYTSLGGAGRPK